MKIKLKSISLILLAFSLMFSATTVSAEGKGYCNVDGFKEELNKLTGPKNDYGVPSYIEQNERIEADPGQDPKEREAYGTLPEKVYQLRIVIANTHSKLLAQQAAAGTYIGQVEYDCRIFYALAGGMNDLTENAKSYEDARKSKANKKLIVEVVIAGTAFIPVGVVLSSAGKAISVGVRVFSAGEKISQSAGTITRAVKVIEINQKSANLTSNATIRETVNEATRKTVIKEAIGSISAESANIIAQAEGLKVMADFVRGIEKGARTVAYTIGAGGTTIVLVDNQEVAQIAAEANPYLHYIETFQAPAMKSIAAEIKAMNKKASEELKEAQKTQDQINKLEEQLENLSKETNQ